jgi:uncharacterized protein
LLLLPLRPRAEQPARPEAKRKLKPKPKPKLNPMLFLLSPAKTLDFDTPVPAAVARRATEPAFTAQAAELVALLRRQSVADVAALMDLSDPLAQLNVERYAAWRPEATAHNSKPALLAFAGEVYLGLQARSLPLAALDWAQQHVLVLSGLYGALRPLDRLQPYRLEMGTRLANRRGADLYAWWGDQIARHIDTLLQGERAPVVVNLASQEYARAALRPALQARVVSCVFEDLQAGQWRVVGVHAKRARGRLCRFAIDERVRSVARLREASFDGYEFAPAASTADRLVFRRALS